MRGVVALIVAVYTGLLGGCVSNSPEAVATNDRFEPMNRAVFSFDQKFDKSVVLPVAGVYLLYLPQPLRNGLHGVVMNLASPVTFANDVLQGEFSKAGVTLGRFTLNSTIGLGGAIDVATPAGLPYHATDFGETLGRYGAPEGPFLVLPFIGPEPPRDLVGDAFDFMLNPLMYLPPGAPLYEHVLTAGTVQTLSPIEEHARNIIVRQLLARGSLDPYSSMRSSYRQLRAEQIGGGLPDSDEPAGK